MSLSHPLVHRAVLATVLAAVTALTAACGGGDGAAGESVEGAGAAGEGGGLDPADWESVLAAAEGQTVNWYMFGGDDRLNDYVQGYVTETAAEFGVTLNQVRINDTVEAVNAVLAEKQAGRDEGGSVDLIWVNGENFATGVQADLWYCGYPQELPSARYYDFDDPALATDFGVPIDGCEAPWNRSQSVLVYDSAAVDAADVDTVDGLMAWAGENPGRYTYAAPPDFTGSMNMRTFFYNAAGGYEDLQGPFDQEVFDQVAPVLWEQLQALEPNLWRGGETYPVDGPAVTDLYATGEIDAFLTYNSGAIAADVEDGTFPETTRSLVFEDGTIGNVNYTAIPYNAANKAGALVVTEILMSPEGQYEKYVDGPRYYPALDPASTGEFAERFAAVETPPSQLPIEEQVVNANPELQPEWLTALERGWIENVLQQ